MVNDIKNNPFMPDAGCNPAEQSCVESAETALDIADGQSIAPVTCDIPTPKDEGVYAEKSSEELEFLRINQCETRIVPSLFSVQAANPPDKGLDVEALGKTVAERQIELETWFGTRFAIQTASSVPPAELIDIVAAELSTVRDVLVKRLEDTSPTISDPVGKCPADNYGRSDYGGIECASDPETERPNPEYTALGSEIERINILLAGVQAGKKSALLDAVDIIVRKKYSAWLNAAEEYVAARTEELMPEEMGTAAYLVRQSFREKFRPAELLETDDLYKIIPETAGINSHLSASILEGIVRSERQMLSEMAHVAWRAAINADSIHGSFNPFGHMKDGAVPKHSPLGTFRAISELLTRLEAVEKLLKEGKVKEAYKLFEEYNKSSERQRTFDETRGNQEYLEAIGKIEYAESIADEVGKVIVAGAVANYSGAFAALTRAGSVGKYAKYVRLLAMGASFEETMRVMNGEVWDLSRSVFENLEDHAGGVTSSTIMFGVLGAAQRGFYTVVRKLGLDLPKTVLWLGSFGTEYAAFTGFEAGSIYVHDIWDAGELLNPLGAVAKSVSSDALLHRLLFLGALKGGGFLARPWTKPMHDAARKMVEERWRPVFEKHEARVKELTDEIETLSDRIAKEGDKAAPQEIQKTRKRLVQLYENLLEVTREQKALLELIPLALRSKANPSLYDGLIRFAEEAIAKLKGFHSAATVTENPDIVLMHSFGDFLPAALHDAAKQVRNSLGSLFKPQAEKPAAPKPEGVEKVKPAAQVGETLAELMESLRRLELTAMLTNEQMHCLERETPDFKKQLRAVADGFLRLQRGGAISQAEIDNVYERIINIGLKPEEMGLEGSPAVKEGLRRESVGKSMKSLRMSSTTGLVLKFNIENIIRNGTDREIREALQIIAERRLSARLDVASTEDLSRAVARIVNSSGDYTIFHSFVDFVVRSEIWNHLSPKWRFDIGLISGRLNILAEAYEGLQSLSQGDWARTRLDEIRMSGQTMYLEIILPRLMRNVKETITALTELAEDARGGAKTQAGAERALQKFEELNRKIKRYLRIIEAFGLELPDARVMYERALAEAMERRNVASPMPPVEQTMEITKPVQQGGGASITIYSFSDGSFVNRNVSKPGQSISFFHGIAVKDLGGGKLELRGEGFRVRRGGELLKKPLLGNYVVTDGDIIEVELSGKIHNIVVRKINISQSGYTSKGSGEAWDHNIRMIYSNKFHDVYLLESIGGNAGPNCAAINGVFDPSTGKIVAFGNLQDLPSEYRSLPHLTIRFNIMTHTITDVYITETVPAHILNGLRALKGLDLLIPMEWHISKPQK